MASRKYEISILYQTYVYLIYFFGIRLQFNCSRTDSQLFLFYSNSTKQRLSFPSWRSKWNQLWSSWPAGICSCVLYDAKQRLGWPWVRLWSSWPGDSSWVLYDGYQWLKLKLSLPKMFLSQNIFNDQRNIKQQIFMLNIFITYFF